MNLKFFFVFLFTYLLIYLITDNNVFSAEIPVDLKSAIDTKSKELQEINQKILQTETALDEAEGKGKTLQKEIKNINLRLNQLNLGIRANEINIEKLSLEVQSLDTDIEKTRSIIKVKKAGLAQLVRELQKKDKENILFLLLKGATISDGFQEIENVNALNAGLSEDVTGLQDLDNALSKKLSVATDKKKKVETEKENLKNRKQITAAQKNDQQNLLQNTKNQERIFIQQIEELKKLQAAVSAEVEKIEAELRAKIDPSLLPIPRPGILAWPITMKEQGGFGHLTQKWGVTSRLYGGKAHNGIDIGAPIGTPVFAAEKGKVLEVWNQDKYCYKGAYGKFIVIEHENNLTTLYAHLSLQNAEKGDSVERGQLIGYVGSTGYATGPHLHLTLYASQTFIVRPSKVNCGPIMPFGGDLDPLKYL